MSESKTLKKTKTVKKTSIKTLKKIDPLLELTALIKKTLEDAKAEDIVIIDLKDKTDLADYMIIASGNSNRHVLSLAEKLVTKLKKQKIIPNVEGKKQADWILIDTLNVIIHIFRPEIRQYYNLEKMWGLVSNFRSESMVG